MHIVTMSLIFTMYRKIDKHLIQGDSYIWTSIQILTGQRMLYTNIHVKMEQVTSKGYVILSILLSAI